MINRELYMEQITPFIDKPFVKVITGIRRCGKSVVLRLIREELLRRGVSEDYIIYMNFESFEWIDMKEAKALYAHIREATKAPGKYYILLDEIQEVTDWEKAVNAFLVDLDVDIYVTGSNSRLLSSEFSTYLAGRYVAFHIMTLSFKEYLLFHNLSLTISASDRKAEFLKYLRMGGFPAIHTANYDYNAIYKIVYDIYSSVILRDTVQRHGIRNVEMLERIVKFVFDNIGNKLNAKNIADYFKSQQRKVDINTIYNYLDALNNRSLFFSVESREEFSALLTKYDLAQLVVAGTLLTPYLTQLESVTFVLKTLTMFAIVFVVSLVFILYISNYVDVFVNRKRYALKEIMGFSHFKILKSRYIVWVMEIIASVILTAINYYFACFFAIMLLDYLFCELLYRTYIKKALYEIEKGA